jgi:hypothetical protein
MGRPHMTETMRQASPERERRDGAVPTRWGGLCLVGYCLAMAAIVWSLISARNWALAELATPRSLEQWHEWREDVREQQTGPGPVRRRVPKSTEPPALVLMRDYFGVSFVGAILFTTVLYWVIAGFVMGMLRQTGGLNR